MAPAGTILTQCCDCPPEAEKPLPMATTTSAPGQEWEFPWREIPWQPIVTSLSIIVSTTVTLIIVCYNHRQNKKISALRNNLSFVNDQLAKLYGPLYGNRLASHKIFEEAIGELVDRETEGLVDYLIKARWIWEKNTTEGQRLLNRWRTFLYYVIHPLDLKAEEIIRDNAHLYEDGCPDVFRDFIVHVNHQKFVVARWKKSERGEKLDMDVEFSENDFSRDNNAGNSTYRLFWTLEEHVTESYEKLVKRKRRLMRLIKESTGNGGGKLEK
ncbi:uncharacterized protein LOC144910762 [Branchiostoma floridae x Branchiostoma belcheri]